MSSRNAKLCGAHRENDLTDLIPFLEISAQDLGSHPRGRHGALPVEIPAQLVSSLLYSRSNKHMHIRTVYGIQSTIGSFTKLYAYDPLRRYSLHLVLLPSNSRFRYSPSSVP